jgi:hypothetical protein
MYILPDLGYLVTAPNFEGSFFWDRGTPRRVSLLMSNLFGSLHSKILPKTIPLFPKLQKPPSFFLKKQIFSQFPCFLYYF